MHEVKEHGVKPGKQRAEMAEEDDWTPGKPKRSSAGRGRGRGGGRGRGRGRGRPASVAKTTPGSGRGKRRRKDVDEDADNLPVAFPGSSALPCHVCSETFDSSRKLLSHVKKMHKEFKCESCGASFTSRKERREHEVKEHGRDFPYACGQCSEKFRVAPRLVYHIRAKHGQMQGKKGARKDGAKREKDAVPGVLNLEKLPSGKQQCDVCSAIFPSARSLLVHSRRHSEHLDIYKCTRFVQFLPF
jgi:hypothetical protein